MPNAVAYANNDVVFLAWKYESALPGCLGFSVRRTDLRSHATAALPAWVGFQGQSNQDWIARTTEEWPVQKFSWRDFSAEPDGYYQYQVVPMTGAPGALIPQIAQAVTSNPVRLGARCGQISAYFNRGILSTQSVSRSLPKGPSGAPNYRKLIDRIDQAGDPLRERLAGQLPQALMLLLERARQESGDCYCALYELNDPELMQMLLGAPQVHIVLSNTGPQDATNSGNRQALHESGIDIADRMLKSGHIGHNKFVVYVDRGGRPQAVLTGSTNWTYSALCGQSNNALLIENSELAGHYFDYWKRLRAEGNEQSPGFRKDNNRGIDIEDLKMTLWFSPNTEKQSKGKDLPGDLKNIFDCIGQAEQAILFLVFQPGTPSIIDAVAQRQNQRPDLIVRGAATDPKCVSQYDTALFHRSADQANADTVVAATAIDDQFAFWQKELLKMSPEAHAIIHDKIVVIDPFSDQCVVVTGSHNLGYAASYQNDENCVIVRGNRALAESYTTHVMDVYDHYRWRWVVQEQQKAGKDPFSGLAPDDGWQKKYFRDSARQDEMAFWASGGVARAAGANG